MMTYTREERPWLSAQKLEFLAMDGPKNMIAPGGTGAWILIQNWIEKREVNYGHEFLRNKIDRSEPLIGFGNRKAIICLNEKDTRDMMIYLTDLFCYAEPDFSCFDPLPKEDTYNAKAHSECYP